MERSLDLLDEGRAEEARGELARALGATQAMAVPMQDPLSEQEFERAFDAAEPEVDQMIDADRVAQVALRQAGADEPHVEGEGGDSMERQEPDELPEGFATATMAELLERQGDADGASRIRASLSVEAPAELPEPPVEALEAPVEALEAPVEALEAPVEALEAPGALDRPLDSSGRPSRREVVRTLERWLDNVREARA